MAVVTNPKLRNYLGEPNNFQISLFCYLLFSCSNIVKLKQLQNDMIKYYKREDMARADSLAQNLSDQDVGGFWKTIHKLNNCKTILANAIYGVSGLNVIASYWKQHFEKLLNVHVHTNCDNSLKDNILIILIKESTITKWLF